MKRDYFLPLPEIALAQGVRLHRPVQHLPERVTLESPALDVMTDLRQCVALTIEPEASIEAANAWMIRRGVRLLFVTDPQDHLVGLISATDILGEKVVQAMQARGVSRQEVLVREIMTPHAYLEAINMDDVRGAKVGHVLSTLKRAGRQHAIVVEVREPTFHESLVALPEQIPLQTVRGLFSATQIARQLGLQVQSPELGTTFAEFEALLAH
ncbi:MAG TPA: CBS domain-containing protein [Burkholderiales bacterium]|nr:CBS domain-containing protein [Burkholderiales bacterium]